SHFFINYAKVAHQLRFRCVMSALDRILNTAKTTGFKKGFAANKNGNIGVFFALLAIPLMIAASLALDSSKVSGMQSSLQDAADAAALAVASAPSTATDQELQTLAQSFFYAHKAVVTQQRGLERGLTERSIIAQVIASETIAAKNSFFVQSEPIVVNVRAQAMMGSRTPEIALVIDNSVKFSTGMVWGDVVQEFETLLTGLRNSAPGGQFRTSLVPFVDRVNPGPIRAINWIVEDSLVDLLNGKVSRGQIRKMLQSPLGQKLLANLPFLKDWNGCLEPRETKGKKMAFELDKKKPSSALFDPTSTKYKKGIAAIPGATTCPNAVLPQTEDLAELIAAMNTMPMGVVGEGRYDEGLAWGWRTLTPEWKGEWGEPNFPANAGTTRKMAVMLTDGFTGSQVYDFGGLGETWPMGPNNGHPIQFEHMVELCGRMKKDDIEIVLFHVIGNEKATPYFKECASPDLYFRINSTKDFQVSVKSLVRSNAGTARLVN
ncbi:MAG: pilus assembly protein TadG-related protein, partial [Notoacmeibacter sp.]